MKYRSKRRPVVFPEYEGFTPEQAEAEIDRVDDARPSDRNERLNDLFMLAGRTWTLFAGAPDESFWADKEVVEE